MAPPTMPTMTAAELRTLISEWVDIARRDAGEMTEVIEGLTGVHVDLGAGNPIPTCPTCGWQSQTENQDDFRIVGYDPADPAAADPPPCIVFGCGHRWTITDIAQRGSGPVQV